VTNFSGIYKILNLCDGKFYIGSAVHIGRRFDEHILKLKSNKHINRYLQCAWNFYGEFSFEFIVIDVCDIDKLIEREQFWIDSLKAVDEGYNILRLAGNSLGYKHTEEFKANRSKLYTGRKMPEETKLKISLALKGKKKSEDFCHKLSINKRNNKNMLGKKHSEESKNKMSLRRKETIDRKLKSDNMCLSLTNQIILEKI